MKKEYFAGVIFVLTDLIVLGITILWRDSLPISQTAGKTSGAIIFFLGMAVFLWISLCLREVFQGITTPVTDRLIVIGPYRWIRHLLYLSMIIILLGIGISLRSLWGIVSTFLLFLPALCYRAMLEEKALNCKFGCTWTENHRHARFLFPFLWLSQEVDNGKRST